MRYAFTCEFYFASHKKEIIEIILFDFFKETEYHKNFNSLKKKEFNERIFNSYYNEQIFFINKEKFKKILRLKSKDFVNVNIETFLKNVELEEFLI